MAKGRSALGARSVGGGEFSLSLRRSLRFPRSSGRVESVRRRTKAPSGSEPDGTSASESERRPLGTSHASVGVATAHACPGGPDERARPTLPESRPHQRGAVQLLRDSTSFRCFAQVHHGAALLDTCGVALSRANGPTSPRAPMTCRIGCSGVHVVSPRTRPIQSLHLPRLGLKLLELLEC